MPDCIDPVARADSADVPRRSPKFLQRASHTGSQTLLRGFDILDALAGDPSSLRDLSQSVGLTKTTTYRLASALLERRYLSHRVGGGYCLGPRLLELKSCAERQIDLGGLAAEPLRAIARRTGDTAHLAVLDEGMVLYLGRAVGHHRLQAGFRLGERLDVATTALGNALVLDRSEQDWRAAYEAARPPLQPQIWKGWKRQMLHYASLDQAFHTDETLGVRSVATPIRDASGTIVAAIGVMSLVCYASETRLADIAAYVKDQASNISAEMGWKTLA